MPTETFMSHAKNHPEQNRMQRIQWSKIKDQEKQIKMLQRQMEMIKELKEI